MDPPRSPLPLICSQRKREGDRGQNQTVGFRTPTPLGLSSWDCLGGREGSLGQTWGLTLGPVNVIQAATSLTLSCPELTAPEAGVGSGGLLSPCPRLWTALLQGGNGVGEGEEVSLRLISKRHGFDPGVGKIPWRTGQSTPVFLPGESHGQKSLEGYSP